MSGFLPLPVNKALLYLPFANKNEVFITKQGFGESWKTSFACFLRDKAKRKRFISKGKTT
jgi:hypothetical protein